MCVENVERRLSNRAEAPAQIVFSASAGVSLHRAVLSVSFPRSSAATERADSALALELFLLVVLALLAFFVEYKAILLYLRVLVHTCVYDQLHLIVYGNLVVLYLSLVQHCV